jgi:hypothetical protein
MAALLFAWGFAEATVFFIVADVAISWIALQRGAKAGLLAALLAACGAMPGIALLYGWAARDGASALALVDAVPWVTPALIEGMRAELVSAGPAAVLAAGATGVPIKIAAVLAPGLGIGAAAFLGAGFVQRLLRFSLAALIAAALARILPQRWTTRVRLVVWAAFWTLFYAAYWTALV